ncbi:MAG: hypothetical protein M3436_08115 [Pseudomonadota bacterium]|nr:hypothetical protein [Pseudomonadota bacterium]
MKRGWEKLLHGVVAGLVLPAVASVYPQTAAAQDRMGEVQYRLQEMQEEMRVLQQELQQMKSREQAQEQHMQQMHADDDAKHKQLEDRVTTAETAPAKHAKKNFVFFRGGYTEYKDLARGFESFTDTHNTLGLGSGNVADDGYYVGAGIEHSLTSDLWGLWQSTEALAEIGLEYKHFKSEPATLVVPTAECALLGVQVGADVANCVVTGDVAKTMFTVSAAPKIKFLEGSKLRPWIIPGGLDFHVISPPSDGATYLDIGVQFGAGVEYEIIPGLKAGIDGRYHLVVDAASDTENNIVQVFDNNGLALTGDTDKDLDFWTVGGYVGFTF